MSDYSELQEVTIEDANRLLGEGWHLLGMFPVAKPLQHPDKKNIFVSKYIRYVVGLPVARADGGRYYVIGKDGIRRTEHPQPGEAVVLKPDEELVRPYGVRPAK